MDANGYATQFEKFMIQSQVVTKNLSGGGKPVNVNANRVGGVYPGSGQLQALEQLLRLLSGVGLFF